ncbi:MAG: hypothetical protein M3R47_00365 [Chloroflexota bacterium]|nr:hypothetical protein [Chloroflexota bacterium]
MKVQRLQGLALMISAVCLLLGLFGPQSISVIGPQATTFFLIVGGILYILGIPAVNSAQPTGWLGLTGIVLLILAALIPLLFRLDMVPSGLADSLSLTSALAGMLGAVIIGWITVREHVFPAWVGWAFIAQGLLNFISGQFNTGFLKGMVPIFLPILYIVALFAYGYFIYQQSIKPTIPIESKVPLA